MKKKITLVSVILSFALQILCGQSVGIGEKLRRSDCFFGIHFDLHASENILDAGKTLTYEMVDTFLLKVKPDFIQIDCKGHPGISSYPTTVGFHVKGFEKDPLKLFREVTEKHKVGLYMHFSGVWDGKVVTEHPDWAVINANGERSKQKVSFFSPYLDTYMIPQLKELSEVYHVDGAWVDGECWAVEPDYGEASLKRFTRETGITEIPVKRTDKYYPEFMEYTRSLFREHLKKYVDAIHAINPDFQITSNWAYSSMMPEKVTVSLDYLSGDVTPQNGVYRSAFEARCLAPQGKPWDLMAWGFSWNGSDMPKSVKSAIQLKQEAAEIIAMGGGVQFYFQQNRDLSIKPWISGILADIGNFVRERQKYCHKAIPVPGVALLYPSLSYQRNSNVPYAGSLTMLQGTLYALLDGQQPVEILMEHHLAGNMDKYPLIVIPECDYLENSFRDEIIKYVKDGGNLLIIGTRTAGLFKDEIGIISDKLKETGPGYITVGGKIGAVRSEIIEVRLKDQDSVISMFYNGSDFNSGTTTPACSMTKLGKGKIAAVYFNAGSSYYAYKTFVIRDFINDIIDMLYSDKVVEVRGSHLVHVAVNTLNDRLYVNLINIAGEHNGHNVIGYDEIPVIKDLVISVRTERKPSSVVLQPEGEKLKYTWQNGRAYLRLPEVRLHSILEIF